MVILSLSDLERIKKNAIAFSKEEETNNKNIIENQKQIINSSAQVDIIYRKIFFFIFFI
jgi:hypothetical protein